jgi:hypothetical protein
VSWRIAVGKGRTRRPTSRVRVVRARSGGGSLSPTPANPANASAPAHTASGSSDATSGGSGPSAASTTNPERCGRVTEPSGRASPTAHPQGARCIRAARRVLPTRRVARLVAHGGEHRGRPEAPPLPAAPRGQGWPLLSVDAAFGCRAHPFARGARTARSHSVRRATVASPPRGGRCPRAALAAAGSRVPCNAHSSSPEVKSREVV